MNFEEKMKENCKRNEKFLTEFETYLKEKNLSDKTICNHICNANIYINDYLNYMGVISAEEGIEEIYDFFNDWFIRKCLWSNKSTIKETASSVKKFYKFMNEKGYISKEEYEDMSDYMKQSMDDFYDSMDRYNNGEYCYPF